MLASSVLERMLRNVCIASLALAGCGGAVARTSSADAGGDRVSVTFDSGTDVTSVLDGARDVAPPLDAFIMGDAAFDGPCPPACTGGCEGGVCTVSCDATSACQNGPIGCPAGLPCKIVCGGTSACFAADIGCATDTPCEIDCGGTTACANARIACPSDAPCEVDCSLTSACLSMTVQCPASASASCAVDCDGNGSCNGGTLTCGAGSCSAKCTNGSGLTVVGCHGQSCSNGC
jgi:hypothetical protein